MADPIDELEARIEVLEARVNRLETQLGIDDDVDTPSDWRGSGNRRW